MVTTTNNSATSGGSGGNGGSANGYGTDAGGGGGGGEGGYGVAVNAPVTYTSTANIAGGSGGGGGAGSPTGGNGGSGGDGGYGIAATIPGANLNTAASVMGGHGGNGGNGGAGTPAPNGSGGNGGAGIFGSGAVINNLGSIEGGNGGAIGTGGGTQGTPTPGIGGAGIVGSNLTVINTGSIAGGMGGNGGGQANAITFTGGANILSLLGSWSLSGNIEVDNGSVAFNPLAALTVGNTIVGTGSVIQTGTGTLSLSGTNSYSGGTAINAGTLSISSDTNLGNSAGGLALNGGTLQTTASLTSGRSITLGGTGGTFSPGAGTTLTLNGGIAGSSLLGLTMAGPGSLALAGNNTYEGGTVVNAGTLSISSDSNLGDSSGGLTLNGAVLQSTASLVTGRAITLSGEGTVAPDAGTTLTLKGPVGGSGGLTLAGPGTLVLHGANSYSGGTTVNIGTLSISSDGNLGNASGPLTMNAGTLHTTATMTSGRSIVLDRATIAPDLGTTLTLNGIVSGNGGLTMDGLGTVVHTGANTYFGATTVNSGTLSISSSANLSDQYNLLILNGGGLHTTANMELVRQITLGDGGGRFSSQAGTSLIQAGSVGGTGSLTVEGNGVLILTGLNMYAGGTMLNAGTLSISADDNLGAAGAGLTFNGGTLQTTANVVTDRPVTLNAGGGTITPAAGTKLTLWQPVSGAGALTMAGPPVHSS